MTQEISFRLTKSKLDTSAKGAYEEVLATLGLDKPNTLSFGYIEDRGAYLGSDSNLLLLYKDGNDFVLTDDHVKLPATHITQSSALSDTLVNHLKSLMRLCMDIGMIERNEATGALSKRETLVNLNANYRLHVGLVSFIYTRMDLDGQRLRAEGLPVKRVSPT